MKTHLSLLILLMAIAPLAAAQNNDSLAALYPFIQFDKNVLHYDSTSNSMRHFISKWHKVETTGQGQISILHMGGSHVQAGVFPHKVRTNLLSAYPSMVSGRGLIFPYSAAAKCNNPDDYKIHCVERVDLTRNVHHNPDHPMGLCGIAITAHDVPTTIQVLLTDKRFDYSATRIVLLGHATDSLIPLLSYEGKPIAPSYIDSSTHRYIFNLRMAVDSFDIHLPCHKGQAFTLTGISLGNRHPGITYSSVGVNGAAVPDYFKCRLSDDLRLMHPDLVIFGIGINDAHGRDFDTVAFKNNYLRLCDSIRQINPNCAFIFITNNDSYRKTGRRRYAVNHNGPLAREVCYRLAEQTGGAVWDQFEIMGGLKSMERWQKAKLARVDKVHFTRAGYQLLGDMLFQALNKEISNWSVTTKPNTSYKEARDSEPPLPRGLRRKPARKVTIKAQPSHNNNPKPDGSEHFPYIPQ